MCLSNIKKNHFTHYVTCLFPRDINTFFYIAHSFLSAGSLLTPQLNKQVTSWSKAMNSSLLTLGSMSFPTHRITHFKDLKICLKNLVFSPTLQIELQDKQTTILQTFVKMNISEALRSDTFSSKRNQDYFKITQSRKRAFFRYICTNNSENAVHLHRSILFW